MDRIYVRQQRLNRLRDEIAKRVFAIPELQREFVWNARKVCDLLDSIYRNYPIGTILIWKTNRRNEGQLRKSFHILPPFDPSNRHINFLIDGQQRLSVLWHLLNGTSSTVKNGDGKVLNFGQVFFDAGSADSESLFAYHSRPKGELATRRVPVVDILSSDWKRRTRGHGARVMARIKECRERILSYEAMLVFCETGSLEQVRDTFIRINSLGMRISSADRAFARASKFSPRDAIRDARSRLQHGFERISPETILQTIALALGGRDVGDRAIQSMISRVENDEQERARFDRQWPVLRTAFEEAVDYMVHTLGVATYDFLPSEPMLATLALFFFHNNNARPSVAAKRQLAKWFWATGVGARYSGRGHRPNILADARLAEQLAKNPRARAPLRVAVPLHTLRSTEYGRPGPLSNAFFCLLRANAPRYLEDGSKLPLGAISARRNRSDKHHIFPRALLSRQGFPAERFNSILNICFLVARENQSIGQRAPQYYFADVPRNLRAQRLALRSHLIPNTPGQGIWDRSVKRGFKQFLHDRARLIARMFEKQAGMRLFERE